jgi:hypothetical protein
MSLFANAVACLLCLVFAFVLCTQKGMLRISLMMLLAVMTSCLYTAYVGNLAIPTLENYPFRMVALTFCVFTTRLRENRRRFMVLAQTFWLWVELVGCVSLLQAGDEAPWIRLAAIAEIALGCCFMAKISREIEFGLIVLWMAVWMFF